MVKLEGKDVFLWPRSISRFKVVYVEAYIHVNVRLR
jgi:hypothetical protein